MLRMSEVTTPATAAYTQAVSANEVKHAEMCIVIVLLLFLTCCYRGVKCYTTLHIFCKIFRALPPSYNISRPILDQYLTLLVDDPVKNEMKLHVYLDV